MERKDVIILDNVPMRTLKNRIDAYQVLFDCQPPVIEVRGTFKDKQGILLSLNLKHYRVDYRLIKRSWFQVLISEGYREVTPEDGIIQEVRISHA